MVDGVRVEVDLDVPHECPIAAVSKSTGARIDWVARSAMDTDGTVSEEFMLPCDVPLDRDDMVEIFQYDSDNLYRFCRNAHQGCPCECIEQFGCPVADIRAEQGVLTLSFHAETMEKAKQIIVALQEDFDSVHLRRLVQSGGTADRHDLVLIDRHCLTDRQREVLQTADEMGYFARPRGANAQEVASTLGIDSSTFSEHLAAAQASLMDALLTS